MSDLKYLSVYELKKVEVYCINKIEALEARAGKLRGEINNLSTKLTWTRT